MSTQNFDVIAEPGNRPIKMWTRGVQVEDEAVQQLRNIASMPFIHRHVAAMPDVHWGMGATVGSVIATHKAIIPAAVGVDIGCVDRDSEYLSPLGWQKISMYDGGLVMQYDPLSGLGEFVIPEAFIKLPCDKFIWFKTKYGVDQMLSPEHRMLCWRIVGRDRHREMEVIPAEKLAAEHERLVLGARVEFETTFSRPLWSGSLEDSVAVPRRDLSEAELRVQVMVNADGHLDERNPENVVAVLRFRKERKIFRCRDLLYAANIEFTENINNIDTVFRFKPPLPTKSYALFWCAHVSELNIIADECLNWDGNRDEHCFYSRNKESADFIQYAFTVSGSRAVQREDTKDGAIDYRVFANPNTMVGITGVPKSSVTYIPSADGFKYCFTLPSGFWVMRRGGNIVMTGNCGMVASRTSLTASDLPDSLSAMRSAIEKNVPHGRTDNGGANDRGAWHDLPNFVVDALRPTTTLAYGLNKIVEKHPKIGQAASRAPHHLCTLGTGNHFIEVCLDHADRVWVMLHSGSRGIGNKIGQYFIEKAKHDMRKWFINLPDEDLAYLPEGTENFDDYVAAVTWAQEYASTNRDLMMRRVLAAIRSVLGRDFDEDLVAVNCHHNYASMENHFGQNVWVTRKGAVRARLGDFGIIPGSMGACSYIVTGKGNPESFTSCSHGAGRALSRGEAKRTITLDQHRAATEGIECRKDKDVLDESPAAYKPIDRVMAAQQDLVEVAYELRQVLNVKG